MARRKDMDSKAMKARLRADRKELLRLAESSEEARRPVELDQTMVGRLSRMDALQGQAMALETGRRRDIELQRIAATLQRIEDGEFGFCVACGEEIAPRRIEHDPTNPVCIDCAETAGG